MSLLLFLAAIPEAGMFSSSADVLGDFVTTRSAPYDAAPNCTPFCGSPLSPAGARRPLPRCCSGLRPPVHGGRISQAWAVGEPAPLARPFASPARVPG